jgi:outer membrane murein-binding lipoprotein Lpp
MPVPYDSSGRVKVLVDGTVAVSGSVTATGGATSAKQDSIITELQGVNAVLPDLALENTLQALLTSLRPYIEHENVTLGADFTITVGSGAARALWVGGAGNLKVTVGGVSITYTAVPAGSLLKIAATLVSSTANGTTASNIVAMA